LRESWRIAQKDLGDGRLLFIDETGIDTKMTRRCGRAPKGKRLHSSVPHGHWKTSTFVAALCQEGMVAPFVIDKAMTGDIFLAYVHQVLCPELREGDTVVMDNLSSHKVKGVAEAIHNAGAKLLYLPPYSPDFNPIENAFSKLKAGLRKAAKRTIPELWDQLASLIETFHPQLCINLIKHAGYTND
jgi:transposase